ncbi:MAG: tetratricopeptide repeat protein [Thermosynechococcaceae cyanobacterium]
MQNKQQKKGRNWFVLVFLVVAVVGLAGVSFVPIFSELFSGNPAQTSTPNPTATLSSRQKELQDLEKSYLIVLEREPDNANVLESLVDTRVQMISLGLKKPADLVDPLTKLVKLFPERTNYQVALAQSQAGAGDLDAASDSFRAILAKDAGNLRAMQGLVEVLVQQKRPQVAVEILQTTLTTAKKVNQIQPGKIDELAINLLLAQVYAEQQDYTPALTIYDDLIKASPKDFRPFYYKAVALRAQGNTAEAQTFFQSAAALAPEQEKVQIKAVAEQGTAPNSAPSPSAPASPPDGGE